ncbi:hypothetical protein [Qipengyuania sp.]|uniref:hypothetical protein n=1 Tax=Qipengyuania sp. TaxID=2004515 RepID=UPI003515A75C
MTSRFSEDDLESLNSLTEKLGRSSRAAIPIFALGIIATLVGSAIAIFYIFSLSDRLEKANVELKRTEAVLEDTNRSLETANRALAQASEQAETPAPVIETAIREVSKSQVDLTQAKRTVSRAATSLPVQTTQQTAQRVSNNDLTGEWVDGYGTTLRITQEGSAFSFVTHGTPIPGFKEPIRGRAEGRVEGNRIRYSYSDNIGRKGRCVARIEPGYRKLEETCVMNDGSRSTTTIVRT